jgi:RNA polymerase sigma-70 factor (ECF subfamily)
MTSDIGSILIEHLPRMRRFAIGLSRSPDVADDLVQAACERVLAAARDGDGADLGNPESYLFRVIRNLWYDRLRRQRTRGEEVDADDVVDLVALHADREPERRLLLARVAGIVDALPPDQRELLLLVCVEEVSYRDAAEILGIPIGTVMSRLARARRRIADATGITGNDL